MEGASHLLCHSTYWLLVQAASRWGMKEGSVEGLRETPRRPSGLYDQQQLSTAGGEGGSSESPTRCRCLGPWEAWGWGRRREDTTPRHSRSSGSRKQQPSKTRRCRRVEGDVPCRGNPQREMAGQVWVLNFYLKLSLSLRSKSSSRRWTRNILLYQSLWDLEYHPVIKSLSLDSSHGAQVPLLRRGSLMGGVSGTPRYLPMSNPNPFYFPNRIPMICPPLGIMCSKEA